MANLIIHVLDTAGNPISQAEVQGTGTGTDPIGISGPLDFTKYTSSTGQITVGLVYLDTYNVSVLISAAGYNALSGTVQTGAITGDYNQTFTLTPLSVNLPPPGQGAPAYVSGFFAEIENWFQSASSSGNAIMTVIVIVVIAIVLIIGFLFVMKVV